MAFKHKLSFLFSILAGITGIFCSAEKAADPARIALERLEKLMSTSEKKLLQREDNVDLSELPVTQIIKMLAAEPVAGKKIIEEAFDNANFFANYQRINLKTKKFEERLPVHLRNIFIALSESFLQCKHDPYIIANGFIDRLNKMYHKEYARQFYPNLNFKYSTKKRHFLDRMIQWYNNKKYNLGQKMTQSETFNYAVKAGFAAGTFTLACWAKNLKLHKKAEETVNAPMESFKTWGYSNFGWFSDSMSGTGFKVMNNNDLNLDPEAQEGRYSFDADLDKVVNQAVKKLTSNSPGANITLLYGPPGNGKTTCGKVIAKKAGCEMISYKPNSAGTALQFETGNNITKSLNQIEEIAKKLGKCVILIDEVDAMGHTRTEKSSNSDSKSHTTTSFFNGIENLANNLKDCNVEIFLATNFKENLDAALISRCGTRKIEVKNPDAEKIKKMVETYIQQKRPGDCNDDAVNKYTLQLIGCSARDIANIGKSLNENSELAIEEAIKDCKDASKSNFFEMNDNSIEVLWEKIPLRDEKEITAEINTLEQIKKVNKEIKILHKDKDAYKGFKKDLQIRISNAFSKSIEKRIEKLIAE